MCNVCNTVGITSVYLRVSVLWRDTISTLEDVQPCVRILSFQGGNHEYCGWYSLLWRDTIGTVGITSTVLIIFPHSTQHPLQYGWYPSTVLNILHRAVGVPSLYWTQDLSRTALTLVHQKMLLKLPTYYVSVSFQRIQLVPNLHIFPFYVNLICYFAKIVLFQSKEFLEYASYCSRMQDAQQHVRYHSSLFFYQFLGNISFAF